jgi:hypothetical protein
MQLEKWSKMPSKMTTIRISFMLPSNKVAPLPSAFVAALFYELVLSIAAAALKKT